MAWSRLLAAVRPEDSRTEPEARTSQTSMSMTVLECADASVWVHDPDDMSQICSAAALSLVWGLACTLQGLPCWTWLDGCPHLDAAAEVC